MEEEVDLRGLHPKHRFLAADQSFVRHLNRNSYRSLCGPLTRSRLQNPKLAPLDGELHVLHVAIVTLEPLRDSLELTVDLGHLRFQFLEWLGGSCPRHDVFALRVGEVVAFERVLAGRRIARHGHTRGRPFPEVAVHHRDDVDPSAEVVRDVSGLPIIARALAVPTVEHRLGRHPELVLGVGRKLDTRVPAHDVLELADDRAEIVAG